MTDGGDGHELHPGDPWHPGWSDAVTDGADAKVPPKDDAVKSKRRRFGRRRHEEAEPVVDVAAEPVVEVVPVDFAEPVQPPAASTRVVADEEPLFAPPPVSHSPEPPMPAWMSDAPTPARDAVLPVELPSWVGTASVGSDVAGGFEEPAPAAIPPAAPADDLEEVLSALGALDDAEVELAGPPVDEDAAADDQAFDALRRVEGTGSDPAGSDALEALEALRRLEAAGAGKPPPPERFGVAGQEAFEELRAGDPDDLSDWAAFAGSASPGAPAAAEPPRIADPEALEAWAEAEPERSKRGIWPFRRRQREDPESPDWAAVEEVPASWFPEVDEDAVVPPPADLPETEWPAAPDSDVTVELALPPQVAPVAKDELRARREAAPRWAEPESSTWAEPEPGAAIPPEPGRAVPERPAPRRLEPEGPPRVRPESVDEAEEADLAAGGPWRLAFDDGTEESAYHPPEYDPQPAAAIADDRWTPEETEELPLAFTEDLYGGAVTVEHRGLADEIFRLGEEETEWQAMAATMPGVETGVVGFDDVADLSHGEEFQEQRRSDFGMRVGTGLLLLVFLLGTMFVGGGAMAWFIGAMAMLGIWEFYGTLRRLEFQPLSLVGYLGGAGMLAAVWFHGPIAVPIALVAVVVVVFFVYAFSPLREDALANGGLTVLGVAWVAGAVAFAFPILRQADFRVLVMALVAATVAMDVGAYAFGRTWGRRALSPVLSPHKSVEGLLGGTLLAVGAAVAFGALAEPFEIGSGIALGIVVSVAAPLGDLAESMVKRSLGVKDMGTILPGHGGVLDRIDGFLFVLPVAWVLYRVIGLLG